MNNKSRYQKIVVPLDGSGWSESVLPHACQVARDHNAEMILVHVFKPPAHEYMTSLMLAGQEEQVQNIRKSEEQKFISLRNQLRDEGYNVRVQWIEGTGVSELIIDYIQQEKPDLVVMSSHGRTGISRFFFGSVAQEILHSVSVPVMIIRPTE
jgi:nucleotide-binding universal stress UspA family protein